MAEKPRVIVLGGLGFVGRNLVSYLVENNLCSKIRAVDKVPPQTAWLNDKQKEAFANSCVEFKSANLRNPGSVEKAFLDNNGFDFCFNCAGETKYGQTKEIYEDGVYNLGINCAKEAAKHNVQRYIEISTAQVYNCDKDKCLVRNACLKSGKKEKEEDGKLNPWTGVGQCKLMVEKELQNIEGLKYVIVRPAIIYGVGARQGITPRLIIGAVYKQLKESMKLLWNKDLKMNTVHIFDVCQALWHLTTHGKNGEVFNLCDKADSSQGSITSLVCEIFGIEHNYFGTVLSNLARVNMESTVEESNDKHMAPWSQACDRDGIQATPLSPYLDQELLYDKHLFIDGTKIEKTGFVYKYPEPTVDAMKEIVQDYVKQGLFPPSLFNSSFS